MKLGYCPFCGEDTDIELVCEDYDTPTFINYYVLCGHCRARGPNHSCVPSWLDEDEGWRALAEAQENAMEGWNDKSLRLDPISRKIQRWYANLLYDLGSWFERCADNIREWTNRNG